MPRTARRRGPAIDSLQEDLQILPVSKAVGGVDKRSLGRVKRIIKNMERIAKPSEIAKAMHISTQKYTSIKRGVKSGKIASPALGDLLEETAQQVQTVSYGEKTATAVIQGGKGAGRNRRETISYIGVPIDFVKDHVSWATNLTPKGGSFQSAINWYANVGGTNEYFWIIIKRGRSGRTGYFIYDIRTAAEHSGHAKGLPQTKELKSVEQLRRHGYKYGIDLGSALI
jgi:hypothetical protein